MRHIFEAVLLVDASNAFNSLNRKAALHNIHSLCPPLAVILTNTLREDTQLFIDNETLHSCERTTQGDPLAMAMYAIDTLPLVHQLQSDGTTQVWFADNATAFGYFANPGKTWFIVKDDHLSTATELFAGTGVNITTEGKRHLGAALGPRSFVTTYVQAKANKWVATIHELTKIAKTQPHVAYSAFTHGLAGKWTYFLRTIPDIAHLLQPLEDTIRHKFIPALTGRNGVSDIDAERDLFLLPVHLGGLGLTNPVEACSHEFTSSVKVTVPLAALILLQ